MALMVAAIVRPRGLVVGKSCSVADIVNLDKAARGLDLEELGRSRTQPGYSYAMLLLESLHAPYIVCVWIFC